MITYSFPWYCAISSRSENPRGPITFLINKKYLPPKSILLNVDRNFFILPVEEVEQVVFDVMLKQEDVFPEAECTFCTFN